MSVVEKPKPSNGNAFIVKLTGDTKGIKSVLKTEWDGEHYDEIEEGVYTKNDGGAFDGLRIAKWLAHEDGKSWRKLKYGDTDSYLRAAADLLKQDKAKAKSILSKPTPRD
jgi:hypothetical protein